MNLSEKVLKKRVFKQKVLDEHIKNYMLGQCQPYLSKSKNTIDIGAATGMYSSYFSDYSKNVYSFEAVPQVYEQLLKIDKPNLHTYNYAVSDKEVTTDFWVDDKRLSNSSLRNLVDGLKIQVDTIKIDDRKIEDVGFIKVDVEGDELKVLNGAVNTIEKYKPTCMVEIYDKFNDGPVEDTFNFFFSRNYKCFTNIKGKGLTQIKNIKTALMYQKKIDITDGDYLFTK